MLKKIILKYICMLFIICTAFISNSSIADNNAKLPILWDFGADKCMPCKKMAPILEKMEKEYKGKLIVKFTDVWKRENIEQAKENNIQSIPTQIFFDANGKEVWRHVGFISEEEILDKCKSYGFEIKKRNEVKNNN